MFNWKSLGAWLFAFCLTPALVGAQDIHMVIRSSWGGLGEPRHAVLSIQGKNNVFRSDSGRVSAPKVEHFLSALEQPPVEKLSAANLGLTPEWLRKNAPEALASVGRGFHKPYPAQEELFRTSFSDALFIERILQGAFASGALDDYPEVEIEARIGERKISLASTSQTQFMLPWTIEKDGHVYVSYDAGIGRAVAGLLPKDFPNRERINGQSLRYVIGTQVMRALRRQWGLLETQARIPAEFAEITRKYSVVKAEFSCLLSVDVQKCEGWNAELQRGDLPANTSIGVSFPFEKGRLAGLESFHDGMDRIVEKVFAVRWLDRLVRSHPDVSLQIRFVEGSSVSSHLFNRVLAELQQHGKSALVSRILREKVELVFVELRGQSRCYSRWFLLSGGEALLWTFQCGAELPFETHDLKTWDSYGWKGTATLVSSDGRVLPDE